MPMFPLGSVLFPGAVLPLQVFEERYLTMLDDIAATDNRFGVVLISRGRDTGGDDERHNIGTVAEIVRKGVAEDGRVLITAVGRDRFRVVDWAEDRPYPAAEIQSIDDIPPSTGFDKALAGASAARNRLMALAIEMGADGQQLQLELPEDPVRAVWALCAAAPIGSFDRQQLLEMDDPLQRLMHVEALLIDQTRDLENALRRG